MGFGTYLANGFRMLLFDKAAAAANATDPESTKNSLILTGILSVVGGLVIAAFFTLLLSGMGEMFGASALTGMAFPVIFVVATLGLFFIYLISTGVYHLLARLMGGKSTIMPFYATYLSMQFALGVVGIGILLLSVIPILGILIQLAWFVYTICLLVFVIREVYQISTARAVFVALIIPVLLFLFLFVLFFIAIGSYFGVLSSGIEPGTARCLVANEFRCENYVIDRVDDTQLAVTGAFRNQLGNSMTLQSMTATSALGTAVCTLSPTDIANGQATSFTCAITSTTGELPSEGEKAKVGFTVVYREIGGSYDRIANGEVAGTIE